MVDAFQNKGGFVPEDLEMLERFAQIAAIAIVNAHLVKWGMRMRAARGTQQRDHAARDELEQRVAAIDSMAQLARQELGLGALASLLAKLTSAHVFILDGLARTRAVEPTTMKPERAGDLLESAACASLLERVARTFNPNGRFVETSTSPPTPSSEGLRCSATWSSRRRNLRQKSSWRFRRSPR